jgi:hypothetical protein
MRGRCNKSADSPDDSAPPFVLLFLRGRSLCPASHHSHWLLLSHPICNQARGDIVRRPSIGSLRSSVHQLYSVQHRVPGSVSTAAPSLARRHS